MNIDQSVHLPIIDPLNPLEQHKHLNFTDPSITITITSHRSIPHRHVIHRGRQAHSQTEISVGEIKLISLKLAWEVYIVSCVDLIDIAAEKLVVIVRAPSIAVVHVVIAAHRLIIIASVSPAIEAETWGDTYTHEATYVRRINTLATEPSSIEASEPSVMMVMTVSMSSSESWLIHVLPKPHMQIK